MVREPEFESGSSVAVVILTWNSVDTIERCLASVMESDEVPMIVVVDNGSTDGTQALVRERFPAAHLLETGENLGYAGGNNVALRSDLVAGHDYALVLNPDAYLHPAAIRTLRTRMDVATTVGASSPIIYYAESDIVWYAGSDIRWSDGATTHLHQGERVPDLPMHARPTGRVNGCAMMLRMLALNEVDGLDEEYFLYYEEADLSVRLLERGWHLELVPEAVCWHANSTSTGGAAGRVYQYYMTRGRLRFLKKHAAGRASRPAVAWLMTHELMWIAKTIGARAAARSARVRVRAVRDFRRNRFGRTAL